MQEPKVIDNWSVHLGKLHGDTDGGRLTTTPAVARDGRIVTTRSGSRYYLGTCKPSLSDEDWINRIDHWIDVSAKDRFEHEVIPVTNQQHKFDALMIAMTAVAVLVLIVALIAIWAKHRKVALPTDRSAMEVPAVELAEAGEPMLDVEVDATDSDSPMAGDEAPINVGGMPRSGKWPAVRKDWLLQYPCCEACGKESMSNPVHHRYPFHLHPQWELLAYLPDGRRQFVTLCPEHHFYFGHDPDGPDGPLPANWSSANEHCIEDCAKYRQRHHPKAKWDVPPAQLLMKIAMFGW